MNGAETQIAPPTSLVGLIDGLIEPQAPPPVSMVPQTWGWLALAVLLAAGVIYGLWRWRAHRAANAYRRAALAALAQATTGAEVAALLRRAALAAYGRPQVAGLTGDAWTDFLRETGQGAFSPQVAAELCRAPYQDETAGASAELRQAATQWLRRHRAAPLSEKAGLGPAKGARA